LSIKEEKDFIFDNSASVKSLLRNLVIFIIFYNDNWSVFIYDKLLLSIFHKRSVLIKIGSRHASAFTVLETPGTSNVVNNSDECWTKKAPGDLLDGFITNYVVSPSST
jgi:hypothetical protein